MAGASRGGEGGEVEGDEGKGCRSVTFYLLQALNLKVLLQLLENPVGASGQALCVKGAAEIRPRTWQVEAASLFSESALSSVPA